MCLLTGESVQRGAVVRVGGGGLDMMDMNWSPHLTCAVAVTTFWLVSPTPSPGWSPPSCWEQLERAAGQLLTRPLLPVTAPTATTSSTSTSSVWCPMSCKVQLGLVGWIYQLQLMVHKVKCFNGNCCSFISRNSSFHFLVLKASFNISRYVSIFTGLLSNYVVPKD